MAPTPGSSTSSGQERFTGVSRCQPLAFPPPPARTGLLGSAGANPWLIRRLRPGLVYWGQQEQPLTLPPARTGLLGSAGDTSDTSASSGQDQSTWVSRRQPLALPPPPTSTSLLGSAGATPDTSSGQDRFTEVRSRQPLALPPSLARTGLLGSAGAKPWHFRLLRPEPVYWGQQGPTLGQDWSTEANRLQPLELPPPSAAPTLGTAASSGQDRSTRVSRHQTLILPPPPARTGLLGSAGANPWHFRLLCQGLFYWGQQAPTPGTSECFGQDLSNNNTVLLGSAVAHPWHFRLLRPGPVDWGQQPETPCSSSDQDRSTGISRRQTLALPPPPARTGLLGSAGDTPGSSTSSGQDRSTGVSRGQPLSLPPPPVRTGLLGSTGANPWHIRLLRPGPVYLGQQAQTPGTSVSSGQDRSTGVSFHQPFGSSASSDQEGLLGSAGASPMAPPPARTGLLGTGLLGSAGANPWHFRLLRPGPVYWSQQAPTPGFPPPVRTGLLGSIYLGQQAQTPGSSASSGQDWSIGVIRRQPLVLPPPVRTGLLGSAGANPWHFRLLLGPVYWGQQAPTPGISAFSGQNWSTRVSRCQPHGSSSSSGKDRSTGINKLKKSPPTSTVLLGSAGAHPGTSASSGQDRSTGISRRQPLALPPLPARTGLLESAGANPWHFRLLRLGPGYWGQQAPTPATSASSGQDWSTGVSRSRPLAHPPPLTRTGLLGSAGAIPWHFCLLRPGPVYWGQSTGISRRQPLALPPPPPRTGLLGSVGANPYHFLLLRSGLVYWGQQVPTPGSSSSSCKDRSTGVSRCTPLALPPPVRTGLLGSAGVNPWVIRLLRPGLVYWDQEAPTPGTSASSGQDWSTWISRLKPLAHPPPPTRTGLLGSAGVNPWLILLLLGPVYCGQQAPTPGTSASSIQDRSTGFSRRHPLHFRLLRPGPVYCGQTGLLGSAGANPWHFRLLRPGPVYWDQQAPTPGTSASSGQDRSTGVSRRQPLAHPPPPARTGLLGSVGANPYHFLLLRSGLVYWGQQAPIPLALPPTAARTGLLGSGGANPWHFHLFRPGPVYWGQQAPTLGTSASSDQDRSTGVSRRQPLAHPPSPARTGLLWSVDANPYHFLLLLSGLIYWGLPPPVRTGLLGSAGVNPWHFRLLLGTVYWCQQAPTPGTSASSGQDLSTGVSWRQPWAFPPPLARTGLLGSAGAPTPGTSASSIQDRSTEDWSIGVSRRQPLALPPPVRTGLLGSTPGIFASSGQDRSTGFSRLKPIAHPPSPA
ncbi:hypothetical protein JTE90_018997 [Oedothorax gibbosus]|uniref:Uncharacterized protein n=1 Tax=Oedothorax gibbosus TaxID=931172 RepID=A0AAV6TLK6_9ARAC|nr:hypothetical protein JTE90_018997 [Oedothorax gibbosus]